MRYQILKEGQQQQEELMSTDPFIHKPEPDVTEPDTEPEPFPSVSLTGPVCSMFLSRWVGARAADTRRASDRKITVNHPKLLMFGLDRTCSLTEPPQGPRVCTVSTVDM